MPRLLRMFGIILILCSSASAQSENHAPSGTQLSNEAATSAPKPLSAIEKQKRRANAAVVTLMVSSLSETGARFAEDMRQEINRGGPGGVRVLPILGNGGQQNLEDLLLLAGVDMAIVGEDHLDDLKDSNPSLYGNIHKVVRYVTKLYNSEVHILARRPFASLKDLDGKRVSLNLKNSHAHSVGRRLFQIAGLQIEGSFQDNHAALEALRSGKLDAHVVVGGAPHPFLASLSPDDDLHIIPVSEDDFPEKTRDVLSRRYIPSLIPHESYPGVIAQGQAVPTVATRALLVVYNWPRGSFRCRRIERFVQAFFDKSETLRNPARHPKWQELNLAADIPGWSRFGAAKSWLINHKADEPMALPEMTGSHGTQMRSEFQQFLTRYEEAPGPETGNDAETEHLYLFEQFMVQQDGEAAK